METTDRLGLPMLVPGQAQKEVTVNEALIMVDTLVHIAVESAEATDPPVDRAPGQAWLLSGSPAGEWAGRDGCIAAWTSAGWRFFAPFEGMSCWDKGSRRRLRFLGGAWELDLPVRAAPRSIAPPQGGGSARSAVDSEARRAIAHILERLRELGLIEG